MKILKELVDLIFEILLLAGTMCLALFNLCLVFLAVIARSAWK